jgi:serine/threonine-protein kinase
MAEVWRAHDQVLERTVAIKFLATGSADNPEFLARLFHEAQSIAAISHPNVIGVLDYGTTTAGPYLVMEYAPGGSLGDLTGTPLAPERAIEIMRQVAAGAGAAHAKGIVHRDIKPGNILSCEDGSVKLADFGIASSEVATNLTSTGAAIGSPHYISPEQAMGEHATPRADVYAMGVVLYELLSGRLPFEGGNATAIAIAHVEEDPQPLSALLPELDPQLDALVMTCLAKQPEARFADGNALAAALADPDFAGAAITSPDEEDTTSFAGAVGAGAVGAGAAGAGAWWARITAGAGQMGAARSSVLKKAAAAVVVLVLLVLLGIHLTSQPGVAAPRKPKQVSSSQPVSHHKRDLSSVTSSPSTTPTTVTVSSSPSTSRPQGPHKSPKPRHPGPSTSVTAATTSTSAPSTTSSTTTTSAPSPTPTPAATAAAR